MFLRTKDAFESYGKKVGRGPQFPNHNVGVILSCALASKADVDAALEKASGSGGAVLDPAKVDTSYGGYIGYM